MYIRTQVMEGSYVSRLLVHYGISEVGTRGKYATTVTQRSNHYHSPIHFDTLRNGAMLSTDL